jgi:DNA repair protein RecO (recombination protein O)
MAEGVPQDSLYRLMSHVLAKLNQGKTPVEVLSILFQMRFLSLAGFRPNFDHCHACKTCLDQIRHESVVSDPSKGGIACPTCGIPANGRLNISKGTLKQLMWTDTGDLERAARIRFAPSAISEGLAFLEAFVPFHIGKSPKSLKVLRSVRSSIAGRKSARMPKNKAV